MKGRTHLYLCGLFVMLLLHQSGRAANSVVVESKTFSIGQPGCAVGIYLANDIALSGIVLPLEIRSGPTPAFIAANFTISYNGSGRVLSDAGLLAKFTNYRGDPDGVNSCSGPTSQTYSAFSSTVAGAAGFYNAPSAVLASAVYSAGNRLDGGSDGDPGTGVPSYVIAFDVGPDVGTIEIDSCCILPANHLVFSDDAAMQVLPSFTKGVITVAEINTIPTDTNCDGAIDIIDVVNVIDVAFRGAPAPAPCGG